MNCVKEKVSLTLAEHCSMHPENSEQELENACAAEHCSMILNTASKS